MKPIVVVGVLIHNNGKVLVGKTHKWFGKWSVFGGKLDYKEKAVDCARREMKEETGLDATSVTYVNWQEGYVEPPEFHKEGHFILLEYLCETEGTDVTLNDEMQEYKWLTLDKALELDLNQYTRNFLEKVKEKKLVELTQP